MIRRKHHPPSSSLSRTTNPKEKWHYITFTCGRCNKEKKSKLIATYGGRWDDLRCNGCYGQLLSKAWNFTSSVMMQLAYWSSLQDGWLIERDARTEWSREGLRLSRLMKGFNLYCTPYSYAKILLAGNVESMVQCLLGSGVASFGGYVEATVSKLT